MIEVFLSIGLFSPSDLGGQHEPHNEEVAGVFSQEDPVLG